MKIFPFLGLPNDGSMHEQRFATYVVAFEIGQGENTSITWFTKLGLFA